MFLQKKDYPYMYARISAKRAKLLDRQDYEKLLKMQPNEIAKKLEEGEYRQEIDELGTDHQGVELVELALNRNLSNTMQHLTKIAPKEVAEIMEVYLRKYDIMTLKRLLRWKKGGQKGDISNLLVPASEFTFEDLEYLADKEFEQIVAEIDFPGSELNYRKYLEGKSQLPEIEKALDTAYFDELYMLADKVESQPFRRFIREEMQHENIVNALRLKKYNVGGEELRKHLHDDVNDTVQRIIESTDVEQAIEIMNQRDIFEGEAETVEELETALERARLQRALKMVHTEPLGLTSILGYLVAKIVEVRNLRMLIRAKEAGIQKPETIEKNLVLE